MELLDILIDIRKGEQPCRNDIMCPKCDKYHLFDNGKACCLSILEYVAEELKKRGVDVLPKWVPADKLLPDEAESVLVCNRYGDVSSGYWTNESLFAEEVVVIWQTDILTPIVAWMPRPDAYKVDEAIVAEDLLKEAVEYALSEPHNITGWVSVKDRLPREGVDVLCCDATGMRFVGRLLHTNKNFNFALWCKPSHAERAPIAWMPLPTPFVPEVR